jgi:hypothetical protein
VVDLSILNTLFNLLLLFVIHQHELAVYWGIRLQVIARLPKLVADFLLKKNDGLHGHMKRQGESGDFVVVV